MNRETKFRGLYREVNRPPKWVYGSLIYTHESREEGLFETWQIMLPERDETGEQLYPVDPSTVGQFTGLRDKNGKDIYEGDIIEVEASWGVYRAPIEYLISDNNGGKHAAFGYNVHSADSEEESYYLSLMDISECKEVVVGTIHDTPDLLSQ